LEAFALIQDEFPTAIVRIMGKGDAEPDLRRKALALGLNTATQQRVEFLGFIPEEQKAAMLAETYCIVNPSMKEGWGIINIEANACGVPVIAANVPGLRDAVQHDKSGLLYEYGDISALAHTLQRVLRDAALYQHLQEGALTFARQFDWNMSAQAMVVQMEQCVEEKRYLTDERKLSHFRKENSH
jgi:glycosyltransferase involved in cell wall biosynthesis